MFNLYKAIEAATAQYTMGIPESIKRPELSLTGWPYQRIYCWECGSQWNVTGVGRMAICSGCHASMRQQHLEGKD